MGLLQSKTPYDRDNQVKIISKNFLACGKFSFCNMCLSLRYSVLGNKFVCVASFGRSFEHQFVLLIACPVQCVFTLSHSLTCVNAMVNISERLATTKTCCIWFNFFVTSIAGSWVILRDTVDIHLKLKYHFKPNIVVDHSAGDDG